MPTKTTVKKPAATRKLKLARYIAATGDLAAALKAYQGFLKRVAEGRKIDVKSFNATLNAMNKGIDNFDKLTDKHEEEVFSYVDQQ